MNRELAITYILSDTLLNHRIYDVRVAMDLVEGVMGLSQLLLQGRELLELLLGCELLLLLQLFLMLDFFLGPSAF